MMRILKEELSTTPKSVQSSNGYILALGFFDCLHSGHRQLLQNQKALAKRYSLEPAVFTFDDEFYDALGLENAKYIYTLDERISIIRNEIGIDKVIVATPSTEFIKKSGDEFLAFLEENNVKGVIAGEDFRYGVNAECGLDDLKRWVLQTDRLLVRQALISAGGRKISTRDIYRLLGYGEVELVNILLCRRYFIDGIVEHGRGVGKSFGLPTANFYTNEHKALPQEGVYSTRAVIDGTVYKAVTNVGGCPTFGNVNKSVETHILGFNGDLYSKNIRIEFVNRLRGIFEFDDKSQLKQQIEKDIRRVLEEND